MISMVIPLVVLFSWIRNLDELAYLSTVATFCILFSLIVILYDEIDMFATSRAAVLRKEGVKLFSFPNLPLFFGSATFAFESVGVVAHLENKMKKPHHAARMIMVAMLITTSFYAVFAVLSNLTFGQKVAASITFNLHSEKTVQKM